MYQLLKLIHILSATFLFGAGTGTALLIFRTYRLKRHSDDSSKFLEFALSHAILVDWFFTLLAGIIQLVTGLSLATMAGYPLGSGWVFVSLITFLFIFLLWSGAAYLQIRMKRCVETADPASPRFTRLFRIWLGLGAPAFSMMLLIFYLMVFKPIL